MEEEEHEVYGGEIPDMEGDMDPHNADVDMSAADEDAVKVLIFSVLVSIVYRENKTLVIYRSSRFLHEELFT